MEESARGHFCHYKSASVSIRKAMGPDRNGVRREGVEFLVKGLVQSSTCQFI